MINILIISSDGNNLLHLGNKPSPEPILIKIFDQDICHNMASLNYNRLRLWCNGLNQWNSGNTEFGEERQWLNIFQWILLIHLGQVTHICVSKQTSIGSDNGLSPGWRQAIIWTNARILLIGPLGTNLREISIEIHKLSFKKMHLKMSSGKWHPFCLGLNELKELFFLYFDHLWPILFTMEFKPNLAKMPLNFSGGPAEHGLSFSIKYAIVWQIYDALQHHLATKS